MYVSWFLQWLFYYNIVILGLDSQEKVFTALL